MIKSCKGPIVGFNTATSWTSFTRVNKCIDFNITHILKQQTAIKVYIGNSHVKTDPYRGLRL